MIMYIMTTMNINVTQVRDNFSEILGRVRFGEEIVTIEKKGKPYAVVISPDEYRRYKESAKKAFAATVSEIQARNSNVREEVVVADISKAVAEVRQQAYEERK